VSETVAPILGIPTEEEYLALLGQGNPESMMVATPIPSTTNSDIVPPSVSGAGDYPPCFVSLNRLVERFQETRT